MKIHELKRGSNNDIVLGLVFSVFSAAISPFFGSGRFSVIGPIFFVTAVVIYRTLSRPIPTTPEEQKVVLFNKVRDRVNTYLNDARRSIFGRDFVIAAERWFGRNSFAKTQTVLHRGLIQNFANTGSLLVLGEPGLGKTLLLLELAQSLVQRDSKKNVHETVPVILNLSGWSARYGNFKEWLIDELESEYQAPRETANYWVKTNSLVLLLDGLDEVAVSQRASCVRALNQYKGHEGVRGIVVCSRAADYESIGVELELTETISLQPLSPQQVDDHLRLLGERCAGLRRALTTNDELSRLAKSPLMLNLLTSIAEEIEELIQKTGDADAKPYLTKLFNIFIRHQLTLKRPASLVFTAGEIVTGLSWLAKAMTESRFLIAEVQPDWLGRISGRKKLLLVLYVFASRLAGTVTVMLVGVVTMWLCHALGWFLSHGEAAVSYRIGLVNVEEGLWKWIVITCVVGGITTFIVDLVSLLVEKDSVADNGTSPRRELVNATIRVAIYMAAFFFAGLYFFDASRAAYGGLVYGVSFGLVFWFRGRDQSTHNDIKIAQRLTWSWQGIWQGARWGTIGGIVFGLLGGLLVLSISGVAVAWHVVVLAVISGPLIGCTLKGLIRSQEMEPLTTPNQGIKTSAQSALRVAIYVAVPFTLVFWAYGMFVTRSFRAILEIGLFFGVGVGMLVGFSYGGFDVLYHYVLRVFLWLEGFRVLRYVRFLECAASLDFLRRTGASYVFSHDLLRQHFQTLKASSKEEIIGPGPAGGLFRLSKSPDKGSAIQSPENLIVRLQC